MPNKLLTRFRLRLIQLRAHINSTILVIVSIIFTFAELISNFRIIYFFLECLVYLSERQTRNVEIRDENKNSLCHILLFGGNKLIDVKNTHTHTHTHLRSNFSLDKTFKNFIKFL